ncbi:hypothetical protein D9757_002602 [Collybiopsis confluens]|uniref:Uncharacterized protein n=1 Tax=Collybiopsis confluens TaxID=2823264 RepID=A0A8H5ME77_9AGAR|nr:hypothetical protein D9757_002602 [Collybiopsis confluens]
MTGMLPHPTSSEPYYSHSYFSKSSVRARPRPLPLPPIVENPRLQTSRSLPPRPLPLPPTPSEIHSPKARPLKVSLPSLLISPFALDFPPPKDARDRSSTSSYPRHRHLSGLLTLDTSSDILGRPLSAASTSKVTLTDSPASILQAPTPRTAMRKRMSKLQRHFGDKIPQELIPLPAIPARQRRGRGNARSPSPAAIIAARLKEIGQEHSMSDDSSSEEDEEGLWDPA